MENTKISEMSLGELFSETLTDAPCIYINSKREAWVATEMCAQYLESAVDSIVVTDEDTVPAGIVGGYDLLDHIRKNPSRDSQYKTKVDQIMFTDVPEVEEKTKLADILQKWRQTRRAFAIMPKNDQYYAISARRMLQVGSRSRTDISISLFPKKKLVSFSIDDTLEKILDLMFENKTRKLLLEGTNQYVSDRLILEEISRIIKFQKNVQDFSQILASQLKLGYIREVKEDIKFDQLCQIMEKMEHPYLSYRDTVVTPLDVCFMLDSGEIKGPLRKTYQKRCPHCGKEI